MKINNPTTGPRGSFGMPAEMKENMERAQQQRAKEENKKEASPEEKAFSEDWPSEEPVSEQVTEEKTEDAKKQEEAINKVNPFEILKEIGIEAKADDFHSIIFRGYVEKVVPIAENPLNGQQLTAKIKTLTADEYDLVDELVAEDLETLKITNAGADIRRTMWSLSFALLELNGKILCAPVFDEKSKDRPYLPKETAKKRRLVLGKLNAFILNKITQVHARMSSAYAILITEPEYKAVKK